MIDEENIKTNETEEENYKTNEPDVEYTKTNEPDVEYTKTNGNEKEKTKTNKTNEKVKQKPKKTTGRIILLLFQDFSICDDLVFKTPDNTKSELELVWKPLNCVRSFFNKKL